MKTLIIILGLLLATVTAFGKPAYKQWKERALNKKALDYSKEEVNSDVAHGYVRLDAYYYHTSKKADGDMIVSAHVFTNGITSGKARVTVTVSTSEEIDFGVGSNKVIIGAYKTEMEVRDNSGAQMAASIFSGGWVSVSDKKTVWVTNRVVMYEADLKVMRVDGGGRFNYNADFGIVDLSAIRKAGYKIIVEPTFKNPTRVDISFYNGYSLMDSYRQIVADAEAKAEADAKARNEANRINKAKQILNDKKYDVNFDGNYYAVSIPQSSADYKLSVDTVLNGGKYAAVVLGVDTNYYASVIDVKFLMKAVNNYDTMQKVIIYTADGELRLEKSFRGYYGVESQWGTLKSAGIPLLTYSFRLSYMSSDMPLMEKMLNSGKRITVRFVGSGAGNGDVYHTFTTSEIKTLKSLIGVAKQLNDVYFIENKYKYQGSVDRWSVWDGSEVRD